jgi:hypothetical protein
LFDVVSYYLGLGFVENHAILGEIFGSQEIFPGSKKLYPTLSVGNAFLKYALEVKGQFEYDSLGQLGSVGVNLSQYGPNEGQPG